ncbi:MAG: T9SS type A sorting domain-containing protein [Bacteroidota bacterium]
MKSMLFLLFVFLLHGITLAQWEQTNGPKPVLKVLSLTSKDSIIFAGTVFSLDWPYNENAFGNVYRSYNKGINWEMAGSGLPYSSSFCVYSVAVEGQYLFAGTNEWIWRSADNGNSWIRVSVGITDPRIKIVGVKDTIVFALTESAMYRSVNHGNNWTKCMSGASAGYAFGSFISNDSAIFVLDGYSGIYRSRNNGANWTKVSAMAGNTLANVGDYIFVNVSNNKILRSNDNGNNWTLINDTIPGSGLFSKDSSLFSSGSGHLYRSDDLGNTWISVNDGIPLENSYSMGADNSSIYAGTVSYGVYRTDNNGLNWVSASNGLPFDRVNTLATQWTNVFAGTNGGGVFLSNDVGNSWTTQNSLLSSLNISSLSIHGIDIYAGTDQGVFISHTFGEHWLPFNNGLTSRDVRALLKDSAGTLFTGTEGGGVFISRDDGDTWSVINTGLTNKNIRCLFKTGSSLYCGTQGGGIFRSINEGSGWTSINTGISNLNVNSITRSGNMLFAGTENGAWISPDYGNTWASASAGLSSQFITSLITAGTQVFAGTHEGVYRYADSGSEWVKVNEGMPDTVVTSLAAGKTDLFAGLLGCGVWTRPLSDFSMLDVSPASLTLNEISGSSDTVFVISSADWIMHGILPDWLWVNKRSGTGNNTLVFETIKANAETQARSAGFYLSSENGKSVAFTVIQKGKSNGTGDYQNHHLKIYPIPTSGQIYIENDIPIAEITISNSEGKIIFSEKPGSLKEVIDLSDHVKGVCFIRIITPEGVSVKKLLVE